MSGVENFIPSGIVGAILLVAAKFYFDKKLTQMRSDLDKNKSEMEARHRENLAEIESDLAKEKGKIEAQQSLIVSGKLSRQNIIDQRRFDAIDKLCTSMKEIHSNGAVYAPMLQVLNLDEIFSEQGKYMNFFSPFFEKDESGNMKYSVPKIDFHQHYIPDKINKLYNFYWRQGASCLALMMAGGMGIDARKMFSNDEGDLNKATIEFFPKFKDFIDEHGKYAWLYFVDYTREVLTLEIRNFINDTEVDYAEIEKRVNILKPEIDPKIEEALKNIPEQLRR